MIIRVTLRDGKFDTTPPSEITVDIKGTDLSWELKKLDDFSPYLVINNNDEKREEAVFATGTWQYAQIIEEEEEADEADTSKLYE